MPRRSKLDKSQPKADWAVKIRALKEALQLNQREFANAIGLPQSVVSRWEAGRKPSPLHYLLLASIAPDPLDAQFFFKKSKVAESRITGLADKLFLPDGRLKHGRIPGATVRVRTFDFVNANSLSDEEVLERVSLPASWIRSPQTTVCLRGTPLFSHPSYQLDEGYVIVDASVSVGELLFGPLETDRLAAIFHGDIQHSFPHESRDEDVPEELRTAGVALGPVLPVLADNQVLALLSLGQWSISIATTSSRDISTFKARPNVKLLGKVIGWVRRTKPPAMLAFPTKQRKRSEMVEG